MKIIFFRSWNRGGRGEKRFGGRKKKKKEKKSAPHQMVISAAALWIKSYRLREGTLRRHRVPLTSDRGHVFTSKVKTLFHRPPKKKGLILRGQKSPNCVLQKKWVYKGIAKVQTPACQKRGGRFAYPRRGVIVRQTASQNG